MHARARRMWRWMVRLQETSGNRTCLSLFCPSLDFLLGMGLPVFDRGNVPVSLPSILHHFPTKRTIFHKCGGALYSLMHFWPTGYQVYRLGLVHPRRRKGRRSKHRPTPKERHPRVECLSRRKPKILPCLPRHSTPKHSSIS